MESEVHQIFGEVELSLKDISNRDGRILSK